MESINDTPSDGIFRIFGLTLSHVNQLSKTGLLWTSRRETIKVEAGDDQSGMTLIYDGDIYEAKPEFNTQPDVSFLITSTVSKTIQMKPVQPNTFEGVTDTEQALKAIVKPHGLTVENNGVDVKLRSPYFPGTTWDQIRYLCQAANCNYYYDRLKNVIAIWPRGGHREGEPTLIAPENGMIGYPEFSILKCTVRTLFNPELTVGKRFKVKSQLEAANGTWTAVEVGHNLASKMPHGPWETHAVGVRGP
jgi:hypothetical protein